MIYQRLQMLGFGHMMKIKATSLVIKDRYLYVEKQKRSLLHHLLMN